MHFLDVAGVELVETDPETFAGVHRLVHFGSAVVTGIILPMVKPHFEVGKGEVGKGGVVRDEGLRQSAADRIARVAAGIGLHYHGRFESPLPGPKGNLEIFLYLQRPK